MKTIKIIAKTDAGGKAIRQHIEECYKLGNFAHNKAFKLMGYRQELIIGPPITLQIEITNPVYQSLIKPKHMMDEIADAMHQNGAIRDIDYTFEATE